MRTIIPILLLACVVSGQTDPVVTGQAQLMPGYQLTITQPKAIDWDSSYIAYSKKSFAKNLLALLQEYKASLKDSMKWERVTEGLPLGVVDMGRKVKTAPTLDGFIRWLENKENKNE